MKRFLLVMLVMCGAIVFSTVPIWANGSERVTKTYIDNLVIYETSSLPDLIQGSGSHIDDFEFPVYNVYENIPKLHYAFESLKAHYPILNYDFVSSESIKNSSYNSQKLELNYKDDHYVWTTNESLSVKDKQHYMSIVSNESIEELSKAQVGVRKGENHVFTVFDAGNNQGLIILMHSPPYAHATCPFDRLEKCSKDIPKENRCYRLMLNYLEFRPQEPGKVLVYLGSTDYYPLPVRDRCVN